MMKAQELRIGNLVTDAYYADLPKVITVESIGDKGVNVGANYETHDWSMSCVLEHDHLFDELHGIPLTEEWLLRFGFEKTFIDITNSNIWKNHTDFEVFQYLNTGTFRFDMLILNDGIDIKHVHQLQNLYFALTGEELTIKQ